MRSSLRRQLLHLATDLSALAAHPDDLGHGFDLLTRSYATPVADAARAALRDDPAIAPLIRERYWGPWPSQAELVALPLESLGHAYASWFAGAGGLELGRVCAPLLAQRWEEGWSRPLADWRERLGITALVANWPFRAETSRG